MQKVEIIMIGACNNICDNHLKMLKEALCRGLERASRERSSELIGGFRIKGISYKVCMIESLP